MLCVCKDNKRKYQSLGISIKAEQWDFKNNCPNDKCPNRERIIILINDRINEIQKIALDKRIAGRVFTPSCLPFSNIDMAWLKRYEAWSKEHNLSVSTISTRLRHLRAVFNLALLEQAIKNDCYPFHAYKVSKLSKETAKRALTKDDVRRIMEYEGKSSMECLAIDIFTFSYLCAGINFIDMAKLKYSNIRDNKLIYNREKTKKLIIVPLQSKAIQLIEKYRNGKSPFIFPILSPFHRTEIQIANRLHKVLAKINKCLKDIGNDLNLPLPLTTYVARHSFATVLKRAGVSTSIISESLGHSSEKITQTYLDSFDNEQIDSAMKNLL